MRRIILTVLVAVILPEAYCQSNELVSYPELNCTEAEIGITYPLDNPLQYYTCKDSNTPLVLECVPGSGYIANGVLRGCVPWQLWDCTYKGGPPACDASQQLTKFPHLQPNLYWSCQGINLPQAFECPAGSAFIACGANNGCQPWAVWSETCPN